MSPRLFYLIVFIEGFCSLGAEVVALRRLVPHVGSAIVVTAPTIGFFLLALAFGYRSGSRVSRAYRATVARNFLLSAALCGFGLAAATIDTLFAHLPDGMAYLVFIGGVLCPLAWLLGQTVPILTNLVQTERSGEAAGRALHGSTLGSFLGSLALSLGMMQWFGVWSAVLLATLLLLLGVVLTERPAWPARAAMATILLASLWLNLGDRSRSETAYADYAVASVERRGLQSPRVFQVNNQVASLLDSSEPPRYARYVGHLRQILLDDLHYRDKDILVLGAGGFTLAHREPLNRYTFVDIDPAIREIAERDFLREPARGEFIAGDARRHVRTTKQRYDAVVVDVYSALTAIPAHLVTREFWGDAGGVLKPGGVLLVNLILDGRLASPYARNLLATIEAVHGRCAVDVLQKGAPVSNVIVSCFPDEKVRPAHIYVDEKNRADLDDHEAP